ncbi:MAG: EamA family transporter [Clostridia bacterium]|nr:EamA family transporter [Clostridia bacterium]
MDILSAFLLLLSASFASVRNVLTKGFSGFSFKNREFFGIQATIFGVGSLALLIVNVVSFDGFSLYTLFLALIYGIMLLCAQWCYTIALTKGKTAICATLYSFGFLIPTLSGAIFWHETITVFGYLGILIVIPVLVISGMGKKSDDKKSSSKAYLPPVIIALICSGGLGVVQKIQQKSAYASQTKMFILLAFIFCFITSLLFFLLLKKGENKILSRNLISCSVIGVFFATCNILNTYLAGRLDSAVFFPLINIGSILLSLLLGFIMYREKLTKKDVCVLLLSALAIILVNF